MASRYFAALKGDRLKDFTECMKQKGEFCHYHVKISNYRRLRDFKNSGFIEVVGKNPLVYIVAPLTAESFKKKYPDVRVQYIESTVYDPQKNKE